MSYAVKNMPDPPDVERCIVTGYPERRRGVIVDRCLMCGEDIHAGEDYYDFNGVIVCGDHRHEYEERFRKTAG